MKNYYLHRDGQNHGPYEETQLRQLIASQQILPEELICEEGGSDWIAASSSASQQAPALQTQQTLVQPQVAGRTVAGTGVGAAGLAQQPKKGMHGCLKALCIGLGVLVILTVIGYYFWSQDNALREYGVAQIEAMGLEEDKKLVYLAMAEHYHLYAANSKPRVTKTSSSRPEKEDYWVALKSDIEKDLLGIPTTPEYNKIAGNNYRMRSSDEDAYYELTLNKDGSYVKTMSYHKNYKDPSETEKGTWKASPTGFEWKPSGESQKPQKILLMGRQGFILKVDSTSASYWKLSR